MKVMGKRAAYVLAAGMVLGGCQWMKPSAKSTTRSGGPPPVQYVPASDGLPTAKIWKSQIAFGDINGDGFPDIGAVSRLADGPYIWVGDGKGHWTDASSGLPRESFCGGGMDFGDANNDGKMDVAIADHCRGVFVYLGDGAGHWKNASAGLPTIGAEDVTVGDFDHDGCLDLAIVAAAEEGVRAFKGDCKGVWREMSKGLTHTEWGQSLVTADIDGDGNLDLAVAYSAGPRVWLGDGKGSWREASEGLPAPDIHGLYQGIAVGDVNGDGKLDLTTGSAKDGVEVFIQGDGGKFYNTAATQCAGGPNSGSFCLTDAQCAGGTCATTICKGVCTGSAAGKACLNDDECADATGTHDPKATCSKGTNFGAACTHSGQNECPAGACSLVSNSHGISAMNVVFGVAMGDLNNDGHVDVVAAGKTALDEIGGVYGVFVFLGDGAGNFTLDEHSGLPITGKEKSWGIGLADVNKDGVLDIGAAFGDVLSPNWHSGPKAEKTKNDKKGDKKDEKKDEKKAADKSAGPTRGMFGSIDVWLGQLHGK